ncbi:ABC transporter permease [Vallitalea okinawensis]|uniref:ABC transporter permease n=1 Tax=Vallitalea okinawensis TaxID=2078660 RepID=UPI000CFD7D8D|nr:ABC transporter permease [Vallitalea okinawensis]
MKSLSILFYIELKLAIREFSAIFFGIIFPVGIVLLMGAIYGDQVAYEGASYTMMQQSFGAFVAVGICATGLMGIPLSLSDYRHNKILKRFKVTPISPAQLLIAQVAVNFLTAIVSGISVFLVSSTIFGYTMTGTLSHFILAYFLVTLSIYALGMLIASVAPNIKIANFLCTLFYFPMLFLSGATIPFEIMPKSLQLAAHIFPLTHGIKLLKGVSLNQSIKAFSTEMVILVLIALVGTVISLKYFKWE